jgi:hypothetical protein
VQVIAFATLRSPDWRWRIVNYAGEMVEESLGSFSTIAEAVVAGGQRLRVIDVVDRSVPVNPYGSTSHLRAR